MSAIHKELAEGKWYKLSLCEQLGNIGSEVNRALRWKNKNEDNFETAVNKALELFDLTINDIRWRKRLREITRARELFCDAITGGKEYDTSLEDLNKYLFYYAFCAQTKKG